ncbi:MAG TPA: hypothetical protein VD978_05520 [Azospirillum sp.]|nr:hypothetical protein [Azospirillum sp.]
MSTRETPKRGALLTGPRVQAAQTLSRAVQTRQRAEAMFQRAERLRRMPAPNVTAEEQEAPPLDEATPV